MLMKEEAEEPELCLLVARVSIHAAGQIHSVITCPLRLIHMFSMCKCRPGCSGRCLLKLPRSAFHLSEKKKYLHCGARPEGYAAKFLPPQQTASPAANSLFNNKDSQKGGFNHVTRCQYRFDICVHNHAKESVLHTCVCVCVSIYNVSMFHDTFLQSDRPHSCHSLAEEKKPSPPKIPNTQPGPQHSTQSREIPLKKNT